MTIIGSAPASRRPAGAALVALAALAALLTAAPARSQGTDLGRLFTTPAERATLDLRRNGAGPAYNNPQLGAAPALPAPVASPPPPPPEPVQLNGVVRRSSGKSTVWLNQQPQIDGSNHLQDDQSLSLRLSSGRIVILKPGQSFNPADGTVQEAGR